METQWTSIRATFGCSSTGPTPTARPKGAGGRRTGWGRIGGKHTLLGMPDLRTAAIQL